MARGGEHELDVEIFGFDQPFRRVRDRGGDASRRDLQRHRVAMGQDGALCVVAGLPGMPPSSVSMLASVIPSEQDGANMVNGR